MTIPQAKRTRLDNGLMIVTESIPTLRSVALGIVIGAGSGDELESEAGLSHFSEHMAFKGTKNRSAFQIAVDVDAVGGRMNAYTGKEQTVFFAVALDKHVKVIADVLSDIFLNPLLDEKDIDMERDVILEEIKMYEDTPDELIHDLFNETILQGHPMGKPTIGNVESIKKFKQDSFLKYRKRLYTPDNVIISAAGNLNHDELVEILASFLKGFAGVKEKRTYEPPKFKPQIRIKTKKTEQLHLCLGVKGFSQLAEDRYAFAVLDNILGATMSSRLFQEIREKRGLAYSVHSMGNPFRDFGTFYVYAGTSRKNIKQVIELILAEFTKMKKSGMTKVELERAKENLLGRLVLGLETSSARMGYLARSEFYYDRIISIDEIFKKVEKVSQDDIIRIANQNFLDEYLNLTIIGDIKKAPLKTLSC